MNDLPHWVNGQLGGTISVHDRGLLYGQSVFETISVVKGSCALRELHLKRLMRGCQALNIPYDAESLEHEIQQACDALFDKPAEKHKTAAVLRIMITMGEGKKSSRGYTNPLNAEATRVVSLHDFPFYPHNYWSEGITLGLSKVRLASQPQLAGIKHSNRLEQVLARSQWQTDWHEAVLLDQSKHVIEATQSNIFLMSEGRLKTPDLSQSGVAGVMREFVLDQADKMAVPTEIVRLSLTDLENADEIFVTNSVIGLWPVNIFQNKRFQDFSISQKLLTTMRDHGAIPTF